MTRQGTSETGAPVPLRLGRTVFVWGQRTYIMGILNLTPDSFSGDGLDSDIEAAVAHAETMAAAGADLIDAGGASSRPGAPPVPVEVEMQRVLPVVSRLAPSLSIPISVDTTSAEVAEAALAAGAVLINDVSGLRGDPRMAEIIAQHGAAVVLMANLRGVPHTDAVAAAIERLEGSLTLARAAGIAPERIMLDPGFGFGPTPSGNFSLLRRLRGLRALGHAVLLGPSRKGTIGAVLGTAVEDRIEGTAALVALAVAHGVDMVRVHDVQVMSRVTRMADAVMRGSWGG